LVASGPCDGPGPPDRRPTGATKLEIRLIRRIAPAFLLGLVACLAAAGGATAEPSPLAQKRAKASEVMAQVQQIDAQLEHAVDAYNAANEKLDRINAEVARNKRHVVLARANLGSAQKRLADRVVQLYTSGERSSTVAVLLGATSLDDLLDRIDTANRVSEQDSTTLEQVIAYRAEVKKRAAELARARAEQAEVVSAKAAQRNSIESQLRERQQMLAGIRSEIRRIQAEEYRRSLAISRQLRAQLPGQGDASSVIGAVGVTSDGSTVAPPARYGGVVGIAMRYLGVPYRWGGASPSGFDCSGFIMYVFAQIGVSLPHNAAAQYGYGSPVSRDQLEAGDLVFFNGLGHAGIYVGGGNFIHAPHTGDVVKISSITGWYASTWVGARRL
jgi:cell wall-associated NlpC family hydrolase